MHQLIRSDLSMQTFSFRLSSGLCIYRGATFVHKGCNWYSRGTTLLRFVANSTTSFLRICYSPALRNARSALVSPAFGTREHMYSASALQNHDTSEPVGAALFCPKFIIQRTAMCRGRNRSSHCDLCTL